MKFDEPFSDVTHSIRNISIFSEMIEAREEFPGKQGSRQLSRNEVRFLLYALDQLLIAKGGRAQSLISFGNPAAKGHGWKPIEEKRT